jgi:uncharacterized membrane protein
MTKREFLDELRNALAGEIPESEIENNVRFYDDYISNKDNSGQDETVINQLGDPRLIAKTIIETYQISHGPLYHNASRHKNAYEDADTKDYDTDKSNNRTYTREEHNGHSNTENRNRGFGFQVNTTLTWYQKLLLGLILILVLVVVIVVGGVLIQVFFSVGIPLLIIYFGYRLIVSNRKY